MTRRTNWLPACSAFLQSGRASVAPGGFVTEMLGEEIEEDADFRREMAAMRIDGVDRELDGLELGEDRDETTGVDIRRSRIASVFASSIGPRATSA